VCEDLESVCVMPSCANCGIKLGDMHKRNSGEFNECGLCKSERVPEPAFYCRKECARAHWQSEHKRWHEKLKQAATGIVKRRNIAGITDSLKKNLEAGEAAGERGDTPFQKKLTLVFRANNEADQALLRGDFREARKLATKAIAILPEYAPAHSTLGTSYMESGDYAGSLPHFLKAMELSEVGTMGHRALGEKGWAIYTASAFISLMHPSSSETAAVPSWFSDAQEVRRIADRAVAAHSSRYTLTMRACAYSFVPPLRLLKYSSSADDLRKALRDRRLLVELHEEGSDDRTEEMDRARNLEAALRARIAADVAAASHLIQDRL